MMSFLKKPYLWLFLFSMVYMAMRLFNLSSLPIFTDEAIYIRWAQIGGRDASWRFISLTDGKQPLFTWFMMLSLRFFQDPLVGGRVVSVASGLLSLIGMYVLGYEVFRSKRVGLISSFLYLMSPFALFYDRMALYDSMVATFFIWNLYLTILLVRSVRLDVALILGMGLGVGMLNKTSAFLSLYMLPGSMLLFDFSGKRVRERFVRWIGYILIAAVLSQVFYAVLRLSPYFYIIAQKDAIFVYPFSEWITHPFQFLEGNIRGMFDWLVSYLSVPVFFLSLVSLLFIWKNPKEKLLLLGEWLCPFIALALFGRVLYPRYILFMVMPLFVLSAWTIHTLIRKINNLGVSVFVIFLVMFPSVILSYGILTDIKAAKLPKSELGQYINDWPSGWGVKEIVSYLKDEAHTGKISIYTEGTFGLMPYAMEIYLGDYKNIDIHGVWPVPSQMPDSIVQSALDHKTYFLMYQSEKAPQAWSLRLLASYPKGLNKNSTMRLYEVVPSKP